MTHPIRACLALAALSLGLPAQDARSTLARLAGDADAVVRVRVLGARTADGMTSVVFRTVAALSGRAPETFTLTEPARRACGHVLAGVTTSAGYLAFLTVGSGGVDLTVRSPRALVPLDPAVLAHTGALLGASTQDARLAVLVDGLGAAHPRVRADAADTLARTPALLRLGAGQRQRVVLGLQHALREEPRVAHTLLLVARRLRLREAVDGIVVHYLDAPAGALDPSLIAALTDLDPGRAVAHIEARMPADVPGQRRAVDLLRSCAGDAAADCLRRLAQSPTPAVASLAAEALLERAHPRPHRFRSILQDPRW